MLEKARIHRAMLDLDEKGAFAVSDVVRETGAAITTVRNTLTATRTMAGSRPRRRRAPWALAALRSCTGSLGRDDGRPCVKWTALMRRWQTFMMRSPRMLASQQPCTAGRQILAGLEDLTLKRDVFTRRLGMAVAAFAAAAARGAGRIRGRRGAARYGGQGRARAACRCLRWRPSKLGGCAYACLGAPEGSPATHSDRHFQPTNRLASEGSDTNCAMPTHIGLRGWCGIFLRLSLKLCQGGGPRQYSASPPRWFLAAARSAPICGESPDFSTSPRCGREQARSASGLEQQREEDRPRPRKAARAPPTACLCPVTRIALESQLATMLRDMGFRAVELPSNMIESATREFEVFHLRARGWVAAVWAAIFSLIRLILALKHVNIFNRKLPVWQTLP